MGMKKVKTIVITIESETKGNPAIIGKSNRVIHVNGEELYRDSSGGDTPNSYDIVSQLEDFLETRKASGFVALPAGLKKWKLFSGTETIPEKEVSPIAINIESLTGPVQVLTFPNTLKDNSVYSPDMNELYEAIFRSLRAITEEAISTFEKSNGSSHPLREDPQ